MRFVLLAGAVFAAALALTFPTDTLVRWLLARVAPPGAPTLVFERARLRPWGLRLERPSLRRPDGSSFLDAEWLTLRPSLLGFFRNRMGLPWLAAVGACAGTVEALGDREGDGGVLTLTWKDVDLAHCPPIALLAARVNGPVGGSATLHAASLGDRRVTLTGINLEGPELHATGEGSVQLAGALGQSALELALIVAPGPQAPPALRDLLARLPPVRPGEETRRLDVGGTIDAPFPLQAP